MEIESKDKPALDISVRIRRSDQEPSLWSNQNPSLIMHHLTWQPGELKTIEMSWTVPQGQYSPGETIAVAGWLMDRTFTPTAIVDVCAGSRFEGH